MKNWKTSVAGLAFAIFTLFAQFGIIPVKYSAPIAAGAVAVMGAMAKDKDVTGAGPNAERIH